MKATTLRRGATLALAGLALAGCGTADKAAEVNGQVITESEAQVASQQITRVFHPPQGFSTGDAVNRLIVAPLIIEYAEKGGHPLSVASARNNLKGLSDPSPATIEIMRAELGISTLTDADKMAIVQKLKKYDVKVNPRYGVYDASRASLVPASPGWLTPSAAQAQQPVPQG